MEEHKIILRMLKVLEAISSKVDIGEHIPAQVFRDTVDFIRTFADKCHHGKEQDNLFPLMVKRGIPETGGPIGVMLKEHDEGRRYTKNTADAIDGYEAGDILQAKVIVKNTRDYVELLRQHISKEDNILYPMGDKVLTSDDNIMLLDEFELIEERVLGSDGHQRYLKMLEGLEAQLSIVSGSGSGTE